MPTYEKEDEYTEILNHDYTLITSGDGTCIVSSSPDSIGKKIKLSNEIFKHKSTRTIEVNGVEKLLVPLRYNEKNVAILILSKEYSKLKKQLALIKQLAELTLGQYLEKNIPATDSTDKFFSKILSPAKQSEFPLFDIEAKVLGYDLNVRRIALVVRLKGFLNNCLLSSDLAGFERDEAIRISKKRIESSLNSFFTKNHDVITAYIGGDKFLVLKNVPEAEEEKFHRLLKQSFNSIFGGLKSPKIERVTVGFGSAGVTVTEIIESFREADLALELGEKVWKKESCFYFGDLGLLSVLADVNPRRRNMFANQILQLLQDDDLLQTLEVFLDENLNLSRTAEKLGIHRNTAIYRLNQINSNLGLDPRVFDQAVEIRIALMIRRFF